MMTYSKSSKDSQENEDPVHAVLVGSDCAFSFGSLEICNAANVCTNGCNFLRGIFASKDFHELALVTVVISKRLTSGAPDLL